MEEKIRKQNEIESESEEPYVQLGERTAHALIEDLRESIQVAYLHSKEGLTGPFHKDLFEGNFFGEIENSWMIAQCAQILIDNGMDWKSDEQEAMGCLKANGIECSIFGCGEVFEFMENYELRAPKRNKRKKA